jgi:hypothetical protein
MLLLGDRGASGEATETSVLSLKVVARLRSFVVMLPLWPSRSGPGSIALSGTGNGKTWLFPHPH